MQLFSKHCVLPIQLFRPSTTLQRRASVNQSKSSDLLHLVFTACVLFCLFSQTAPAQQFHIPEPKPLSRTIRQAFDLDPFYQQWVDVKGFPVVASEKVNPYALKEAAWIVWQMIEHRRNVLLRAMVENKLRVVVIAHTEMVTQIPEHSNSHPNFYWDIRSRGFGSTPYEPTASCSEENLLNYPGDPYVGENVHIHEFAHALHWVWDTVTPGFDNRLRGAYDAAIRKGLWQGTYAGSNHYEYWAEGVQSWFNTNLENVGVHNHVNTRAELKEYDPRLAVLVAEVFGDRNWRYTEATTRTNQPHLRGFNPQDSPTFVWPPELLALHEELKRNPESTGDGRWVNLERYEPSELPRLQASRRDGAFTQIFIGNLGAEDVRVYFIEPDGTERFRVDLPKNDMADPFDTQVGALWLVKDENGKNLAVYRAKAKTGRALITREYKGPQVNIPDKNLAAAVRDNLGLVSREPITQDILETLTELDAVESQVKSLTGLEHATGLVRLSLWNNQIKNLAPLATLTKLRQLHLQTNQITDITPLTKLRQLTHLHLWGNQIQDISALAGLRKLKSLWLDNNQIRDVSSLVGLSKLEELTLGENPIQDMSPLQTLLKRNPDMKLDIDSNGTPTDTDSDFAAAGPKIEGPWLWMVVPTAKKDASEVAASGKDYLAAASKGAVTEEQIATDGAVAGERVKNRAWTLGRLAPTGEDNITEMVNAIGLKKGTPINHHVAYGSIVLESLGKQNTRMYAGSDDNHKVWLNGELVHEQLNWHWAQDYQESVPVTLKKGKNVLLVAVENAEGPWGGYFGFHQDAVYSPVTTSTVQTVPAQHPSIYWIAQSEEDLEIFTLYRFVAGKVENLVPSVKNAVNLAVDTTNNKIYWTEQTGEDKGRIRRANLDGSNVQLVINSPGVPLGIAVDAAKGKLYWTDTKGRLRRANLNGKQARTLIKNLEAPILSIALDTARGKLYWAENAGNKGSLRRANLTGKNIQNIARDLDFINSIAIADNKIYWAETSGTGGRIGDANLDGSNLSTFVNLQNTPVGITVDAAQGKLYWTDIQNIQRANLNGKRNIENVVSNSGIPSFIALGSASSVAGAPVNSSLVLSQAIIPESTSLLANYPNPFNPETWIPYQLAEPSDVKITIYDTRGVVVRYLALGHQSAGTYTSRTHAAYWDGRNSQGESVASGVYFYTLKAGEFTTTRKMLIRK